MWAGGLGRWTVIAGVGAALFVLIVGIGLARHLGAARAGEQSVTLEPQPFVSTLSLTGVIVPGASVDVVSPLEGVVKAVGFDYGQPVTEGQILAAIDPRDAEQMRDEAKASYLKARESAADMAAWSSGPEVSRARRALASADLDLKTTQRRMAETKSLLDRGLVARSEYDDLVEQARSQRMGLAAAQEDLAATLRQGQGGNAEAVALELQVAHARLTDLDSQLAGTVVRAPATGVIVRPPADKADAPVQIHVGLQLARGQLIGSIAGNGGLAVAFQLSEADADRVAPGQGVSVSGPGFEGIALRGRVQSVAGEASPANAGSGPMAAFAAVARLDPMTPAQARAVRIGMTANVTVEIYHNAAALVAPPEAIEGSGADAQVRVRPEGGGAVRRVAVRLGHVGPDGVEILSGLKAGDALVWTPAPQTLTDVVNTATP